MKKLVSLILALVMVFAMATTAMAAYPNVVGTHGVHANGDADASIGDGVDTFDSANASTSVAIKVTAGETVHKYAVDVEYTDLSMSITGGSLTWDVNKLQYVATGNSGMTNKEGNTITVKNYSDLPVWVTATITDNDNNDLIEVSYNGTSDVDANGVAGKRQVDDALTGTVGTLSIVYDVKATGDDWEAVSAYYAPKLGSAVNNTITVATIAVTIYKDEPNA